MELQLQSASLAKADRDRQSGEAIGNAENERQKGGNRDGIEKIKECMDLKEKGGGWKEVEEVDEMWRLGCNARFR